MTGTAIGILLVCVGAFAFAAGLVRPGAGMGRWRRWRILIGGPVAIALGILLLTGVIGG
jgi:2-methylaconitate cis-trans-isomerase PrpF